MYRDETILPAISAPNAYILIQKQAISCQNVFKNDLFNIICFKKAVKYFSLIKKVVYLQR